jgi:hypothetical protein
MGDSVGEAPTRDGGSRRRARGIRLGALVALGLGAALLAWLLIDRSGDEAPSGAALPAAAETPAVPVLAPAIVSETELERLAAASGAPIYWAGPRAGAQLEVSRTADGAFYVRYLPEGEAAGSAGAALTVATYPRPDAFAEVSAAAETSTGALELPGGGIAVYERDQPTNVHLAFPGQGFQVEVFSPGGDLAVALVRSGERRGGKCC